MTAGTDPLVGQLLEGRFLVESRLGKGGMGIVYAAEDVQLRRRCALKILRPESTEEDGNVERFLREAQAIARLSHEHIVNIFSLGRDPSGAVFFAMELLSGVDLEVRLRDRERPVHWREMCEWAVQIARAVAAVHEAGLIHRDLKPGNVFLARRRDGSEFVKLLDFGIVRPEDSEMTSTGATLGTPHYMSPEQVRAGQVDRRSDIYSFGVLLFRALTGRLPFRGEPFQVAMMHVESPAPRASDVAPDKELPDSLSDLVLRTMSKDPSQRYESMEAVEHALREILRDPGPISTPRPQPVTTPAPPKPLFTPAPSKPIFTAPIDAAPPPTKPIVAASTPDKPLIISAPSPTPAATTPAPPPASARPTQPASAVQSPPSIRPPPPEPPTQVIRMMGASESTQVIRPVQFTTAPRPRVPPSSPLDAHLTVDPPTAPKHHALVAASTVAAAEAPRRSPARLLAFAAALVVTLLAVFIASRETPAPPPTPATPQPVTASQPAPPAVTPSPQPTPRPPVEPTTPDAPAITTPEPAPAPEPAPPTPLVVPPTKRTTPPAAVDPLKALAKQAKSCRRTYKAEDTAKIDIDYATAATGKVTRAVPSQDSDLGKCLAEAVRQTTFEPKLLLGQRISL